MLTPSAKARLRLAIVAVALVPFALLARVIASSALSEFVQRGWATAWQRYDASTSDSVRDADGGTIDP